jgi:hypothetical protein
LFFPHNLFEGINELLGYAKHWFTHCLWIFIQIANALQNVWLWNGILSPWSNFCCCRILTIEQFFDIPNLIIGLEIKWLIWQSSWKLYILIQLMIMQLPITCCTMWDANFENKTSNWFSFLKVITIVNFCEVGENKFVSFFCIEISSLHCFWDTFKCVWLPSRVFVVLCEWTWLLDEQLKQCWCLCELER